VIVRLGLMSFLVTIVGSGSQIPGRQVSPFACDRLALATLHFDQLSPQLQSLLNGIRELPNGYAFRFPADPATVALVAEWAADERLCSS